MMMFRITTILFAGYVSGAATPATATVFHAAPAAVEQRRDRDQTVVILDGTEVLRINDDPTEIRPADAAVVSPVDYFPYADGTWRFVVEGTAIDFPLTISSLKRMSPRGSTNGFGWTHPMLIAYTDPATGSRILSPSYFDNGVYGVFEFDGTVDGKPFNFRAQQFYGPDGTIPGTVRIAGSGFEANLTFMQETTAFSWSTPDLSVNTLGGELGDDVIKLRPGIAIYAVQAVNADDPNEWILVTSYRDARWESWLGTSFMRSSYPVFSYICTHIRSLVVQSPTCSASTSPDGVQIVDLAGGAGRLVTFKPFGPFSGTSVLLTKSDQLAPTH